MNTLDPTRLCHPVIVALSLLASPAWGQGFTFPPAFTMQEIAVNGTTIHVRVGGHGPAVVLLHGFGETGDMWAPLAATLAADHTVVVPDLRGMGLSARVAAGFDKKNQAEDVAGVMDALHLERADVIAHDIGNMVAFAFAAQHGDRVTRLVMMDAPVPGVGPWEEILKNPLLWHFRFGGPDMERLVAGRERIYLDRFWNDFSANPARFDEAARQHYAALYARPGVMHAGFAQFAAFDQDAIDNRAMLGRGRLKMPVLAIGGDHSFGPTMAHVMRFGADQVTESVVADAGHWLMEEQPGPTVAVIQSFLAQSATAEDSHLAAQSLSRGEVDRLPRSGAGARHLRRTRHRDHDPLGGPDQTGSLCHRDTGSPQYPHCTPWPPGRSHWYGRFRDLVLRVWDDGRCGARQGPFARGALH